MKTLRGTFIYEVYCPICRRMWSGEFRDSTITRDVCKDCIRQGEGSCKDSKDIHNRRKR